MTTQQSGASTMVDFLLTQQKRNDQAAENAAARMRSQAVAKGIESRTDYGRAIYYRTGEMFLQRLEDLVTGFVLDPAIAGPHYSALPLLLWFSSRGLAPVAATTLVVVLDQLSTERPQRSLANAIGRAVEEESRAVAMFRRAEATAKTVQKAEGKRGLISTRTLEAFGLRAERWERRDRVELGALLLDVLLASTPILVAISRLRKGRRVVILSASAWAREFMQQPAQPPGKRKAPLPVAAPITVDSEGVLERVRRRDGAPLIYLQGHQLHLQARALTRASHVALRLDPWMVDVVKRAWEGGAPVFSVPTPVTETDLPIAGKRRWVAERERRQHIKGQLKVDGAIRLMAEMAPYKEAIYMDHVLDFRGRIYTNSGQLTYQGPDFMKGCLQFAESGGELDLDQARMAAAAHWGHGLDRATWSDRLEWGQYHTIPMAEAAKDPMGCRWWMDADSPWQLLQVCRAIESFNQGQQDAYLPVRFDQTCSGVGHIAALTRNHDLALLTNMIGDCRRDVYSEIALQVERALGRDLEFDPRNRRMAEIWLERGITRSLMKKPVLSAVYGARHYSIRDGFAEILLRDTPLSHPSDYERLIVRPAIYLAGAVVHQMQQTIPAVFEVQKWMSQVVKTITKAGAEVEWTSPSGMPCRLWSHRDGRRPVRTHLSGTMGWWNDDSEQRSTELSGMASGPGATANLIHSLDAAVVHLVWDEAEGSLLATHDCFAVPCSAERTVALKQVLRRALMKCYVSPTATLTALWTEMADNARLPPYKLPAPPVSVGPWEVIRLGENPYLFS